jgi:hypothetical protein
MALISAVHGAHLCGAWRSSLRCMALILLLKKLQMRDDSNIVVKKVC